MAANSPDDAERASDFLNKMAERDQGKIIILNLEAGLRLGSIAPQLCKDFLRSCASSQAATPDQALIVFAELVKSGPYQFIGKCPHLIGVSGALVIRSDILLSEEVNLLEKAQVAILQNSGAAIADLGKSPADRKIFLEHLQNGKILRTNAALGGSGRLAWITRVDTCWEKLIAQCEKSESPNHVRNQLGLPHAAGLVYFEVRTRETLDAYIDRDRRAGAPTAFDAGTHPRFRQEPDQNASDGWNRTVDLDRAFRAPSEQTDGVPELVVEYFNVSELEWTRCLGVANANAPGTHSDFVKLLFRRHPEGKREMIHMVRSVVERACVS